MPLPPIVPREIEKNGGRCVYALYPDEGHGLARPENRLDLYARVERFFAEHLGGRCEPFAEGVDRYPGSSAVVREVAPHAGARV